MSPEEHKQIRSVQPQSGETSAAGQEESPGSVAPASSAQNERSVLRRRLLLRGLVGGPVALAAMRPVRTLAAKKYYCKKSGWSSFKVNAKTSAVPKQTCKAGKKVTYYQNGAGWPTSIPNSGGQSISISCTSTQWKHLFAGADTTLCNSYLGSSPAVNQTYFCCALFNAQLVSGFPFTVAQIYQIWNNPATLGTGVTQTQAALFLGQLCYYS